MLVHYVIHAQLELLSMATHMASVCIAVVHHSKPTM